MNPFSMMMAADKESAKREIPPPLIQKVIQKGKRGRSPTIKKESVVINPFPVADSTGVTSLEMTKRRNYETGDGKNDMDKAVNIVIFYSPLNHFISCINNQNSMNVTCFQGHFHV